MSKVPQDWSVQAKTYFECVYRAESAPRTSVRPVECGRNLSDEEAKRHPRSGRTRRRVAGAWRSCTSIEHPLASN